MRAVGLQGIAWLCKAKVFGWHSGLKHSDWRAASHWTQIHSPPAQFHANRAAYRPRLGVVPAVGRGGSKFFSLHSAWRGKLLFVHSNIELRSHFLLTPTVSLRWVWTSRTSFASLLTWWLLPFSPASSRHIQRLILIDPVAVVHATSCHLLQVWGWLQTLDVE